VRNRMNKDVIRADTPPVASPFFNPAVDPARRHVPDDYRDARSEFQQGCFEFHAPPCTAVPGPLCCSQETGAVEAPSVSTFKMKDEWVDQNGKQIACATISFSF
jgi:hypothetical protein